MWIAKGSGFTSAQQQVIKQLSAYEALAEVHKLLVDRHFQQHCLFPSLPFAVVVLLCGQEASEVINSYHLLPALSWASNPKATMDHGFVWSFDPAC